MKAMINSKNVAASMNRMNQPTANSPANLRFKIQDSEAAPAAAEPKLLVTVATKIGEDQARRFRHIVVSSGMTDAQLFRLILDRADVLFQKWDERINPRFLSACSS